MSATLTNGKEEIMTVGKGYHKLGTVVDDAQTWQQTIVKAGLDWQVDKRPLYTAAGLELPTFGIFRQDTDAFLGAVGKDYTPIQNKFAFSFVDSLLESVDGAHYTFAGSIDDGRQIWCLARVPMDLRIKGTDDISQSYLFFTTFHGKKGCAQVSISTVRGICDNQLPAYMAESKNLGKLVRVKHTRNAEERMNDSVAALSDVRSNIKTLEDKLNVLATRKMTHESTFEVMTRLFPNHNGNAIVQDKIANVLENFEDNDGNAFPTQRGTAYSLLNAFTDYIDHDRKVYQSGSEEELERTRVKSALMGSGAKDKQVALETILEATAANPTKQTTTVIDMKERVEINDMLSMVYASSNN